jgi:hypothetical protein
MRLTAEERVILAVLENALDVSDYTDVVDVYGRQPKMDRIINALVDMLSISSGLMVSNNLTRGENLMKTRSLSDNIDFFRNMFEVKLFIHNHQSNLLIHNSDWQKIQNNESF